MPTLPNFFIAGAAKAGTTSLYHYLDQHPDIYMSPMKEPSFFSEEVRPENFEPAFREQATREEEESHRYIQGPMDHKRFSGIVRRWDDYIRLFAKAGTQSARGEGSVTYLWSPTAARAIASRIPDARIILILRDPADRAFSQYLHNVTGTLSRLSFRDHVEASLSHARTGLSIYHPFLERGLYAEQVQRLYGCLPPHPARYLALRRHPPLPPVLLRSPPVPRRRPQLRPGRLHPPSTTAGAALEVPVPTPSS